MTTASGTRGVRMPRGERRQQLLVAALETFVTHGYHAAAMDDIADRAGVSKPVLYQHFPGKLDLYLALLDAGTDQLVAAVAEALAGTTDNKARVEGTINAYFTFVAEQAGAFRLVFESDLTAEPAVRERVDRADRACALAVSAVISEDTGLDHEAAMLLAMGLTGAAQVAARYWLTQGRAVPQDTAVSLVSALSWRGISGFPRTGEADADLLG
ncbi:MAG: TetR/AcrR family transcriptional regulator [Actinomycetes bacterium]